MKRRTLITAAGSLVLAMAASAQGQTWFVDPVNGANGPQTPTEANPYSSITFALSAAAGVATPQNPVTITCRPGVYSTISGESWPLLFPDNVHVRGAGARKCILRALPGDVADFQPFYPSFTLVTPLRAFRLILVDFSFLSDDATVVESIDGFTLQAGDVQVYCESETNDIEFRVSNCLFDMVNSTGTMPSGEITPSFGVLMVHNYDASNTGAFKPGYDGYWAIGAHLLNNTFIQGWRDYSPLVEGMPPVDLVGNADSVAICNSTSEESQPAFTGIADLNLQNNLIRSLPGSPRTATLGIDSTDMTCTVGSAPGLTNAFSSQLAVIGASVGNTFFVGLPTGEVAPSPAVELLPQTGGAPAAVDANFLGEQLQSRVIADPGDPNPYPYGVAFDPRLFPVIATHPLDGQGSGPSGAGVIAAASGLSYVEPTTSPALAFAYDCDGYGNRRTKAEIDIGYDEIDLLAITGSYANHSISHNVVPNCLPLTGPGVPERYMILTSPIGSGLTPTFALAVNATDCGPGSGGGYEPPLSLVPALTLAGFTAPDDQLYMDITHPSYSSIPLGGWTVDGYANTFDGTPYFYGRVRLSIATDTSAGAWLNQQVVIQLSDNAQQVVATQLTNMQSELF